MHNPSERLEVAAELANGEDPAAIGELTAIVLTSPHVFRLPAHLLSILSMELADAEMKYRNKNGSGVTETQIITSINLLGETLKVPDYARTTQAQMRTLRLSLAAASPVFMGDELPITELNEEESIQSSLSPLQAAHLLCTMLSQKCLNEAYEDADIDPTVMTEERNRQIKTLMEKDKVKDGCVGLTRPVSVKRAEIRHAATTAIRSMSVNDILALADRVLRTTGLR